MKKERVSFKSQGQKIVGTFLTVDLLTKKLPGVVFYHGRGSSQKGYINRAEAVVKEGIICLTFDFRGHGKSEGNFSTLSLKDGLADALSAFDYLASQNQVDRNRLGICGRSFGGYLAALVSGKREVKSLILSVPAIYKDDWTDMVYERIPIGELREFRYGGDIKNTKAVKAIKKFKNNLFVIGHEKDEVIPEHVVRIYYETAKKARKRKITFIKKAGHQLDKPEFNQQFKKLISDWFRKTL